MTSQCLASMSFGKPSGGSPSPHAPTTYIALAAAVKSWPPGGGALEAGATWVWPLSVTFGAAAAAGSGFGGSAFSGSGADGIVDGVVTGALDAGPAPPFAGSLPWHAATSTAAHRRGRISDRIMQRNRGVRYSSATSMTASISPRRTATRTRPGN